MKTLISRTISLLLAGGVSVSASALNILMTKDDGYQSAKMEFPEFVEFPHKRRSLPPMQREQVPEQEITPEGQINIAYLSMREGLASDLLEQIHR